MNALTSTRRRTSLLAVAALVLPLGVLTAPAADASPTWLNEKTLSRATANAIIPAQVAVDSRGNVTAVWGQYVGARLVIHARSRPAGGLWTTPVPLSDDAYDSLAPDIVADGRGRITVVWQRYDGFHHLIEASTRKPGGSWTEPVDVSRDENDASAPRLALGPSGVVRAVWQGNDGTYNVIRTASRAPGKAWTAPVDLSDPGASSGAPQAAIDPQGRSTVVWQRNNGVDPAIVQASSKAPGTGWSDPDDLSDTSRTAIAPQVGVDASGNVTALWQQSTGTGAVVATSRRPLGGDWSEPKHLSAQSVDAYNPQLTVDRKGNAAATWYTYDGIEYIVEAATRRAGHGWSGKVEISRTGSSFDPKVVIDRRGTATAAWFEFAGDGNYVLVASRWSPGRAWTNPREVSTDDHPAGPGLDLAVDPARDVVAVWDIESAPGIHQVGANAFDVAGPAVLAFGVPRLGRTHTRISFSAKAKDTWAGVAVYRWKFGDGTAARSKAVTHTYSRAGTYRVKLVVTDKVGNTTVRTRSIVVRR